MTTDPAVTVVFFAIGFLAFCGVGAAYSAYTEWRDEVDARRTSRRLKVLLSNYGYDLDEPTPDYVPTEWAA